jgi:hypothetical protein
MYFSFCRAASAARTPVETSTPAARRWSKPRPLTSGFGSSIAATTRTIPALMSASVQGGVRR